MHGTIAFTLREKACVLTVYQGFFLGSHTNLLPPEPTHFFAFSRFATPAGSMPLTTRWLYTLFGYTYSEYSSLLIVYPDRVESRLLHRSQDLPL